MEYNDPGGCSQVESVGLKHLREMDWKRFEILCRDYFVAKGHQARLTDIGADGGIDVIVYQPSEKGNQQKTYVQCKAWSQQKVGVKAVRELYGVMAADGVRSGVFMTTSDFTGDARVFARENNLQLISGEELLQRISKLSREKQQQLRKAALSGDYKTPTCPSCDIKMVLRTANKGKNRGEKFWGCSKFPSCRQKLHLKNSPGTAEQGNKDSNKYTYGGGAFSGSYKEGSFNHGANSSHSTSRPKKRHPPLTSGQKAVLAVLFSTASIFLITEAISFALSGIERSVLERTQKQEIHREAELTEVRRPPDQAVLQQRPSAQVSKSGAEAKAEQDRAKALQASLERQRRQQEWKEKNESWLAWYKEPWDCQDWRSDDHMVECTNHKMRAKREFEELWSQGKIPYP
ncbi:MAG: restriction endonuclease [Endozoicomonas sp.]